jgi:hypothetical protein
METDKQATRTGHSLTKGLSRGRVRRGRPVGQGTEHVFTAIIQGNALKIRRIYSMYRNDQVITAALFALAAASDSVRALCFEESILEIEGREVMQPDLPLVKRIQEMREKHELAEDAQASSATVAADAGNSPLAKAS